MATNKEIKRIYEKKLLPKKRRVSDDDLILKYILKYLPKNKNINILDAGCGEGRYIRKLNELGYNNIFAVDLFDNIPDANIKYVQASIEHLPFPDKFFDFLYSHSVIYYLDDPSKSFGEFQRVLRKDAIAFLTAHTKYSLFTLDIKLKLFQGLKGHLRGVTFRTSIAYANSLKEKGFNIIRLDGFQFSFFLYPLFKRLSTALYEKCGGIILPMKEDHITSNKIWAFLKSILAYHAIIVASNSLSLHD